MLRALFSAVSGMSANQDAMDVIGNNIANANTVGFKDSRTDFASAFYQIDKAATTTTPVGQQVGLGVSVVSTPTIFTQGSFESTGVDTDLAINGSGMANSGGFFVVSNSTDSSVTDATTELTRAGDFTENNSGYLITQDGYYVMGHDAATGPFTTAEPLNALQAIQIPATITTGTPPVTEQVSTFTVGNDGTVTAIGQNGGTLVVGYIGLATYSNPEGLTNLGNNRYAYNAAAGASAAVNAAGQGSSGVIQQGSLELSNVDLADQFSNMIITQRGFDANSKTITASDEMLQTVISMIR